MSHCTEVSSSAYVGEAGWNQCLWKNSLRRWISRKVKADPPILFQFCTDRSRAVDLMKLWAHTGHFASNVRKKHLQTFKAWLKTIWNTKLIMSGKWKPAPCPFRIIFHQHYFVPNVVFSVAIYSPAASQPLIWPHTENKWHSQGDFLLIHKGVLKLSFFMLQPVMRILLIQLQKIWIKSCIVRISPYVFISYQNSKISGLPLALIKGVATSIWSATIV